MAMRAVVYNAKCQSEDTSAAQSAGLEACVGTKDSVGICKTSDPLAAPTRTSSAGREPTDLQGMEDTGDFRGSSRPRDWSF